jgi:translocation and assembly module TamA
MALLTSSMAWPAARAQDPAVEDPNASAPAPDTTAAPEDALDAGEPAAEGLPYRVEITGSAHGTLGDLLEASSQLVALADRPPASLVGLERRAVGDLERLEAVLRSEGYHDGDVDYAIDESTRPLRVTLTVSRGDPYQLESVALRYLDADGNVMDGSDQGLPTDPGMLGLEVGRRGRGPAVVAAENTALRLLTENGYPYPEKLDRRIYIDRENHTLAVELEFAPGPRAGFGPLWVEGLDEVNESYVRLVRPWIRGQPYDRRLLDRFRRDLVETNLFTSIAIAPAGPPDAYGNVPIRLNLSERDHRTFGGGLSWGTDEGFVVSTFWEHRNLFGSDETFRLEAEVGEIEQLLRGIFAKPRFLRNDQTLLADVTARREDTDAYKEVALSSAIGLEREFNEIWDGKLGVSAELSDITENRDDRTLWIFGLPGSFIRDTRDNTFNPARGTRLEMAVTPFITAGDDQLLFTVTEFGGSAYQSLHPKDRVVLAGRLNLGSILGQSRAEVPASKRFYAGGGGSIRGYEFQKVGPLDAEGDPLGGRSLLEVSGELRLRFGERLGVVPFIDGGTVFTDPDFTSTEEDAMRWAWGLGFRYFTLVGPLRVDFAFPLDQRDNEDDFQFYISIGQAF